VVLAEALLLVRVVWMQIVDKLHTFRRCLLHLRLLSTSRMLREKLWLMWLCYWRDGRIPLRGFALI
jgi:hypothetical protein